MDTDFNGIQHFEFLHSLIDDYKLNGEIEGESDSDSEGYPEEDLYDSEDLCGNELEAHVLRKKIKHLDCDYSSEDDFDEESLIFGHPSSKTVGGIQQSQKKLKKQADIIRRAMDLNSKMRDGLLSIEQSLVHILHGIMNKKQLLKQSECSYKIVDNKSEMEILNANRGFYKQFGMPYFKDKDGFPCPQNEDTKQKILNNQLIVSRLYHYNWKVDDMKALEIGIKNCLIDDYKEMYERRTGEMLKRDSNNEVSKYSKYVKNNDLSVLLQSEPHRNFDWMKISASKFGERHSSTECQNLWNLYLKPTISKQKWSEEENEALKVITDKYNCQNWDCIAHELNTSRSGYLCFIHYQTSISGTLNSGFWAKEENKRLSNIVKMCRYGSFIAWPKVCYYMEGRTFAQIYAHWTNSLDPHLRKGKFSKKEDTVILEGIYKHGKDCKEIAKLLGNRNSTQVRERFENRLKPLLENRVGEWSLEEDKQLLALVQELGDQKSRWAEIARRFKTRSRTQIRHRYTNLKKKMNENPNFLLEKLQRPVKRSNEKVQIGKRQKLLARIATTVGRGRSKTKHKVKIPKNVTKMVNGAALNPKNDNENNISTVKPVVRRYGGKVKNSKVIKENIITSEPKKQDENATLENKDS